MTDITGGTPPQQERQPAADQAATATSTPSSSYENWPTKGGDQPQPWDRKALNLSGDEPNPVELDAGLPILGPGSQGPEVTELAQQLAALGYDSSVTRGQNPYGVYDESVSNAVAGFRRDYGVAEDPSAFLRDNNAQATSHAGPWTILAIRRASEREKAAA